MVIHQKRLVQRAPHPAIIYMQSLIDDSAAEASVDAALHLLAERVCRLVNASEAIILLQQGNRLLLHASYGAENTRLLRPIPVETTPVEQWVLRYASTLCIADVRSDQRFRDTAYRRRRVASLAATPIRAEGRAIGVLEVAAMDQRDFTSSQEVLATFGDVVGIVVEQAHVTQRAYSSLVEEFLHTVRHDLKTPLTAIQGYAQLIQRRAVREGRARDAQTGVVIMEQAQRMVSILNELRAATPLGTQDGARTDRTDRHAPNATGAHMH